MQKRLLIAWKRSWLHLSKREVGSTLTDTAPAIADGTAMKSFLESMILYPVDSIVELSNGEQARVVKNIPHYILRPVVVGLTSGNVYNLGEDINCANIIIL